MNHGRRRFGFLFLLVALVGALWWKFNPSPAEIWLAEQARDAVEMRICAYYSVPIYHGEKTCYASTTKRREIENLLGQLKCPGALTSQKNIAPSYSLTDYGRFFSISLRHRSGQWVYVTLCPSSPQRFRYDLVHFGVPATRSTILGATTVSSTSYGAFSDAFEALWKKTGQRSTQP